MNFAAKSLREIRAYSGGVGAVIHADRRPSAPEQRRQKRNHDRIISGAGKSRYLSPAPNQTAGTSDDLTPVIISLPGGIIHLEAFFMSKESESFVHAGLTFLFTVGMLALVIGALLASCGI